MTEDKCEENKKSEHTHEGGTKLHAEYPNRMKEASYEEFTHTDGECEGTIAEALT